MPNYKQTDLSGTAYQRCHQVVIDNPLGATPTIRFDEEEVAQLGTRDLKRGMGTLALPFDPAKTIALRDPATGLVTGKTSSYGAAYVLLYSAYLDAAEARDVALAPPPAQPIV